MGALTRLEQLVQEVSMNVPRALIAETINVIVFISGRGRTRRVEAIARVVGLGANGYQLTHELASAPLPSLPSLPSLPGEPS
jgi:type IV secretion system protein VirB11